MLAEEAWFIVDLAIRGILIKPLLILWFISLCVVRQKGDHARLGFSYLKAAYPIIILMLILYVGADAVIIALSELEESWGYEWSQYDVIDYPPYRNNRLLLQNITDRLESLGVLFESFADLLLMLCFVELGNGFLYCLMRLRTFLQKSVRYGAICASVVAFGLAVAQFGVVNTQFSRYYDYQAAQVSTFNYTTDEWELSGPEFDWGSFDNAFVVSNRLAAAFDAIMFVADLALIVFLAYVVYAVRHQPRLNDSVVMILVSTIMMLLHHVWSIVLDGVYYIPERELPLAVGNVVDPILRDWTYLVVLILLFVVGVRKRKGLWSIQQSLAYRTAIQQQAPVRGYASQPGVAVPGHLLNPPQYRSAPHELAWRPQQDMQQQLDSRPSPRGELEQPAAVYEMK